MSALGDVRLTIGESTDYGDGSNEREACLRSAARRHDVRRDALIATRSQRSGIQSAIFRNGLVRKPTAGTNSLI